MDTNKEEIWHIIISNMVKKRNSIIPVVGEDTIVYSLGILLVALRWFGTGSRKAWSSTLR